MRATAVLGGLEVSSEKAERERPRRLPLHLAPQRSGSRLPRPQTVFPGPPPSRPPRFDVGRGLPGAPGIGWQSRLSGAAAVTLRLGLPGREEAGVC